MTKRMFVAAAAAVLLPLAANAGPMKPGKWRVTVDTPGGKKTIERCITPQEADNTMPPKMKDESCRVESLNVSKSSVSWKVSCAKTGTSVESKTVYEGDTFRGETRFKMADGRVMSQRTTGKYVGACAVATKKK
jgi:hypothetical protein